MIGIVSLLLWALFLTVTVKYVLFLMRADNKGEGGILALTALLGRSVPGSAFLFLTTLGIFGTAMLYGDGMITPAISVLSAVEGLGVATRRGLGDAGAEIGDRDRPAALAHEPTRHGHAHDRARRDRRACGRARRRARAHRH